MPLMSSQQPCHLSEYIKEIHSSCFGKFIIELGAIVGKPGLLHSHALDCVGCMQIYPRLSKSIAKDNQALKTIRIP